MLKSIKNISLGLAILSLLSACTKQRIYLFEEENVHYDWTVLATNDSANERFVLDIKKNNEKFIEYEKKMNILTEIKHEYPNLGNILYEF